MHAYLQYVKYVGGSRALALRAVRDGEVGVNHMYHYLRLDQ
jgi:hypothetical protein